MVYRRATAGDCRVMPVIVQDSTGHAEEKSGYPLMRESLRDCGMFKKALSQPPNPSAPRRAVYYRRPQQAKV
jgi:hypothetical protein